MENTLLGRRYRLTEKIGTGGMADVYKAVDETLGRTVAVKVMHTKYASDPNFAARFRQEAQAAANLQSPYIVNIYDWGQENSTYYIVMEYVRGTDLKTMIKEKGALPSKQVADIGAQVCAGLAVAHGYDIIHRDVKPHNIMVTPDGNIKVMDFGIARAGNTTMTQTGSVLGSAHYVSPEQAQGRQLTATSDLYSLGIVLYEACTGRMPFDAETPVAIALKQVNEQAVRPRQINPSVDPGLEAIIGKVLDKNPSHRYQTAEEMRRDLIRVTRGQAVGTPLADASMGAGMTQVIGAATPIPGDATSVMPVVGRSTMPGGNPPEIRPVPTRNKSVWIWVAVAVALVLAGLGVAWNLGLVGGPKGVAVPSVVGKTLEQAKTDITTAKFVVGKTTEVFDDKIAAGSIVDQSPAAGATAEVGSEVTLIISKGPELVEVPDIVDTTEEEARAALTALGFMPDPQPDQYSAEVKGGVIISQDPEAGTSLPKGSSIKYVPSRGVEMLEVPNVVGKKSSTAKSDLTTLGFTVKVVEEFSSTVESGIVISQNPGAGITVSKDSKITIAVSKGKEVVQVDVPDVVGLTIAAATSTLESLGLKVNLIYEPHSSNNVVLEQDPGPGASVPQGSTISMIVDAVQP